jgi:hypothetical protein
MIAKLFRVLLRSLGGVQDVNGNLRLSATAGVGATIAAGIGPLNALLLRTSLHQSKSAMSPARVHVHPNSAKSIGSGA